MWFAGRILLRSRAWCPEENVKRAATYFSTGSLSKEISFIWIPWTDSGKFLDRWEMIAPSLRQQSVPLTPSFEKATAAWCPCSCPLCFNDRRSQKYNDWMNGETLPLLGVPITRFRKVEWICLPRWRQRPNNSGKCRASHHVEFDEYRKDHHGFGHVHPRAVQKYF